MTAQVNGSSAVLVHFTLKLEDGSTAESTRSSGKPALFRLGDGSPVSHQKMQQSLDGLWRFTAELFHADELDLQLAEQGIAADPRQLEAPWLALVEETLQQATLTLPAEQAFRHGGKQSRHSEHLGPLLAEMQFLQRAYPNANW